MPGVSFSRLYVPPRVPETLPDEYNTLIAQQGAIAHWRLDGDWTNAITPLFCGGFSWDHRSHSSAFDWVSEVPVGLVGQSILRIGPKRYGSLDVMPAPWDGPFLPISLSLWVKANAGANGALALWGTVGLSFPVGCPVWIVTYLLGAPIATSWKWLNQPNATTTTATVEGASDGWHHYAVTVDVSGRVRIYVDGTRVMDREPTQLPTDRNRPPDNPGWWRICADGFSGTYDSVAWWDRVLSAKEIRDQHWRGTHAP